MGSLNTTIFSKPSNNTDYYAVYYDDFDDIKFIDNHMRNGLFKSGIIKDPLLIYQILQLPEYSIKA